MTPEELNRKMEFIIETQAHFGASLEREHEMCEERLAEFEKRLAQSENTQKSLAILQTQLVEMIRIESDRLDRQDKMHRDSEIRHQESQKTNEKFQRDALHLLHQILDRLTKPS